MKKVCWGGQRSSWYHVRRILLPGSGFEEGRDKEPMKGDNFKKLGEAEMEFPWSLREGAQPTSILILAPWHLCQVSNPLELKENRVVLSLSAEEGTLEYAKPLLYHWAPSPSPISHKVWPFVTETREDWHGVCNASIRPTGCSWEHVSYLEAVALFFHWLIFLLTRFEPGYI